jgi:hypothetical protein
MSPVGSPGPDGDDLARLLDDIDSGRVPVPSEDELRARAVLSQVFAQEQVADAMPPGPLLAVLAAPLSKCRLPRQSNPRTSGRAMTSTSRTGVPESGPRVRATLFQP